jgi:hypothetical protein
MDTLDEYIRLANSVIDSNPHIRYGQALFNILPKDMANEIRGTALDPFYEDNLDDFLTWLEGRLIEMNEESVS